MSSTGPQLMAKRWNSLAQLDAMHYIATSRRDWDLRAFKRSGIAPVERAMAWLGDEIRRERLLEIGCGLCRTAMHFAEHFTRVDAVDISEAMIEQARRLDLPANLTLTANADSHLAIFEDGAFDAVYSALVFQHVPDDAVLRGYLEETRRVLASDGRAILQYDTRPPSPIISLYKRLPDPLLPPRHRRCIRRYRRPVGTIRRWIEDADFTIVDERGVGTAEHFLLLRAGSTV